MIPEMSGGLSAACGFSALEDFMEDDYHQATRGDPLLSSQVPFDQYDGQQDLSQDRNYHASEDESLSPESIDRMELSA